METALALKQSTDQLLHHPPFVILLNKADLQDRWEIPDVEISRWRARDWPVLETSAKTGSQVETAFRTLAQAMV